MNSKEPVKIWLPTTEVKVTIQDGWLHMVDEILMELKPIKDKDAMGFSSKDDDII